MLLEDGNIKERHTASKNYGIFEFTYESAESAYVVLYTKECSAYRYENGRIYLTGSQNGGRDAYISAMFDVSSAVSVAEYDVSVPNGYKPEIAEKAKAILVKFDQAIVTIPFVLSALGFESLDECYENEAKGKGYDDVLAECKAAWNEVLGKIRVEGGDEARKRVFYTAVYRATSRMHNYSVNGKYFGFDKQNS